MHPHLIALAHQAASTDSAKAFTGSTAGQIALAVAFLVVLYCLFSPKKKTSS
jgi:hypothetical protein